MIKLSFKCIYKLVIIILVYVPLILAENSCLKWTSNQNWSILINRIDSFKLESVGSDYHGLDTSVGYFRCITSCKLHFWNVPLGFLLSEDQQNVLKSVAQKMNESTVGIFYIRNQSMDQLGDIFHSSSFAEGYYFNEFSNIFYVWNTTKLDLLVLYEGNGTEYVLKENTSIRYIEFSLNRSVIILRLVKQEKQFWTSDIDFLYLTQEPDNFLKSEYGSLNTTIIPTKNICEATIMFNGIVFVFEIIGGIILVMVAAVVSIIMCKVYTQRKRKSNTQQSHLNWISNNAKVKYIHQKENGILQDDSEDNRVYIEPIELHNYNVPDSDIIKTYDLSGKKVEGIQRESIQKLPDDEFVYDYAYSMFPGNPNKSKKSQKGMNKDKKMSIPKEDEYYM